MTSTSDKDDSPRHTGDTEETMNLENKHTSVKSGTSNLSYGSDTEHSIYDQLGQLDVDELDNLISLADNMAIKLAFETAGKLKNAKT